MANFKTLEIGKNYNGKLNAQNFILFKFENTVTFDETYRISVGGAVVGTAMLKYKEKTYVEDLNPIHMLLGLGLNTNIDVLTKLLTKVSNMPIRPLDSMYILVMKWIDRDDAVLQGLEPFTCEKPWELI